MGEPMDLSVSEIPMPTSHQENMSFAGSLPWHRPSVNPLSHGLNTVPNIGSSDQNFPSSTGFQPFTFNARGKGNFRGSLRGISHLGNNFVRGGTLSSNIQHPLFPDSLKKYLTRARSAISEEDEPKLRAYFNKRLQPLLDSRTAHMVNWDTEPLPHELNFELRVNWTPSKPITVPKIHESSSQPESSKWTPVISSESGSEPKTPPKKKKRKNSKKKDSFFIDNSPDPQVAELFFSSEPKKAVGKKLQPVAVSQQKLNERAKRFANFTTPAGPSTSSQGHQQVMLIQKNLRAPLVGTCRTVEKSFFRLTSAADPALVRPLNVLQEAFDLMKKKYAANAEYSYLLSQLRSIRQDLTVQRIRNKFTVQVYEAQGRICLKNKDFAEFNQCQNQLRQLYEEVSNNSNEAEFTAYRLLYYIYLNNYMDIMCLLRHLPLRIKEDECMRFALDVSTAFVRGEYLRLFRLNTRPPKLMAFLMDLFIPRERKAFLNIIFKAHRTPLPLNALSRWFSMPPDDIRAWFSEMKINLSDDGLLDCKAYANFEVE